MPIKNRATLVYLDSLVMSKVELFAEEMPSDNYLSDLSIFFIFTRILAVYLTATRYLSEKYSRKVCKRVL